MNKGVAITIFESLSSGVWLDIYRLLVRMGPDGLVAGETASSLNVPPTNLSFRLKTLTHASLLIGSVVVQRWQGQQTVRRAHSLQLRRQRLSETADRV